MQQLRMAGRAGAGVYGSREWSGRVGPYTVDVMFGGLFVVVRQRGSGRELALQGDDAAELVAAWERADAELVELLADYWPEGDA